jgi:hypothetical protein
VSGIDASSTACSRFLIAALSLAVLPASADDASDRNRNPSLLAERDAMKAYFDKYMSWNAIKDDFANFYLATFSDDELTVIAECYKTSARYKLALAMPDLMAKGAAIGQLSESPLGGTQGRRHRGREAAEGQTAVEIAAGDAPITGLGAKVLRTRASVAPSRYHLYAHTVAGQCGAGQLAPPLEGASRMTLPSFSFPA